MKNRIWKQIRRTSIAAAAAGTVLVGNIQPGTVLASAFQSGPNPKVEQSCFWTDREKGMAELDIRITGLKDWIMERRISDGNENLPEITESENKQEMEEEDEYMEELASGKTVYEENETQEEESEGSQEGTTSGGEDVENESSAMILENEEVTEQDQNPEESEEESGENKNPDVEPEPVTCVVYVSEYFSPETTSLPENVQTQQIPVKNQKGEDTEITKLVYKIETENFHEESILLQIPLSLREEYRYPVEETSYLLVQDEPLQKDCDGAGTALLVKENGSTQILAERISPILIVEAAKADMILSVTSETEEMKAGKTIRYRVDLANTGALDLENIRMTSSFSCPKITQQWEEAQGAMKKILDHLGLDYKVGIDEAAFYGPKLDIQIKNVFGKEDTLITIQIDMLLAQKFGMTYVGEDGKDHFPYIIHRTSIGCYERTLALLLEKYAGALPTWLMPTQAMIIPISEKHHDYAQKVLEKLQAAGIRVEADWRSEKMGYKIREAQLKKIPYMLVVGEKEAETDSVSVRTRKGTDGGAMSVDEFVQMICEEIREKRR